MWTYFGGSEECADCERRTVCHGSMCVGTSFQIVGRKGTRSYCKLREGNVESVQIRKPDTSIALDARLAKEGATFKFKRVSCATWTCPYRELCDPFSLADGDRIKIVRVERTFPCAMDSVKTLSVAKVNPL